MFGRSKKKDSINTETPAPGRDQQTVEIPVPAAETPEPGPAPETPSQTAPDPGGDPVATFPAGGGQKTGASIAPPIKPFAKRKPDMSDASAFKPQIPRKVVDVPHPSTNGPHDRQASEPAPPSPSFGHTDSKTLVVGRDIKLSGEISACDRLVVVGEVKADLTDCRELIIEADGHFNGKATVEQAQVSGRMSGDLTVTGTLTVSSGGHIDGNTTYETLIVQAGGKLSGSVKPSN